MKIKIFLPILVLLTGTLLSACTAASTLDPVSLEEKELLFSTITLTIHITDTATPTVTSTATLTQTPTPTFMPIVTPTALGGGSGQILFFGQGGAGINFKTSIFKYDLTTLSSELFLEDIIYVNQYPQGNRFLVYQATDIGRQETFGDLYFVDSDGLNLEYIASEVYWQMLDSAAWLEDPDLIVYIQRVKGFNQLFSHSLAGLKTQLTFSAVGVRQFHPGMINGGILWEETYTEENKNRLDTNKWTSLDGTKTSTIETPQKSILWGLSPDGKYFWSRNFDRFSSSFDELYIYDLEGADPVIFNMEEYSEDLPVEYFRHLYGFLWLPDSRQFLVSISYVPPEGGVVEEHKTLLLSLDGELLGEVQLGEYYSEYWSQWSPDGRQLLYLCVIKGYCMLDVESLQILEVVNLQTADVD